MLKLTIEENDAGQRLDRFLRKYLKRAPLSSIYRMIRKDVKVNGKRAKEDRMLEVGDELTLYLPEEQVKVLAKATAPARARRQFGIAYEDDSVLIVDKPSGLLTHGDSSEKKNTLVNQVCGYLQQKGEYDPTREKVFRPAPINRLDRNTSGLVIFGKSAEATRQLTGMLRERDAVRKFYMTIVCGRLEEERIIEEALTKDSDRNMVSVSGGGARAAGDTAGKASVSIVRPMIPGNDFSLVEVELVTGRTHQIRVHLAHIGHPLAADPKYGDPNINRKLKKEGLTTQLLHAGRLQFGAEATVSGAAEIEGAEDGASRSGASGSGATKGGALDDLKGKVVEAEPPADFRKAQKLLIAEHKET